MSSHDPNVVPKLQLRGAREHNLRGVDLDLPLGTWTAVTGPSGSGKTSLVFDTIVKEGQRRYLGSLSARARHFFGKLGAADLDSLVGLPAAVAVGEAALTSSSRSTVGTLTGALDLLRLLFARCATDPGGVALTRSHFSFNHPDGTCEACRGVGLEDFVDPALLVADSARSIKEGALTPTLKNGYTVYSQVTLDVMNDICVAHGFDVSTPWRELTSAQHDIIFFGTKALKVPFGKHSIESRMKWEGITARPREEGFYRGLIPVIEETLKRNRNPNILRFVRSVPCSACAGSRLARPGREAMLGGQNMPALLALPASQLAAAFAALPRTEVQEALEPALLQRVGRLCQLGLGHLSLDRTSPSLSGGEAQRIRLAAQLTAGLGGLLIALDEPTLGLHPSGQSGMAEVLNELRELGNTLLVVEHDPEMVLHADRHVSLGPGAGEEGGQLLCEGPLDGLPLGGVPLAKETRREARGALALRGATLHNLQGDPLDIGLGVFNVIMGPSGAGKSSLLFGTLWPALSRERGGAFESLTGAPEGSVRAVDARPIGRNPRSTPATWSGLFDIVRKRFAETDVAKSRGLKAGHFSYNNKLGRCQACEGLGVTRVGLHMLENIELTCTACRGGRFAPEILDVLWNGKSIAAVLAMSVREAIPFFEKDKALHAMCLAMDSLGLGYLALGQPSNQLSRGEAQRIKLSTLLGTTDAKPTLVLLDEPDRGLHPSDVELLLRAIDALVEIGHTVVAISHHRFVWAAADHLIAVADGRVQCGVSLEECAPVVVAAKLRPASTVPASIELRGVTTNNLDGVDVSIPHGALTVIAGVSGSGKSSLAFGTLASEAWHRFAESLPFQVRRFVRRMPRPKLESATGLTPVLSLRQGQARAGARSTVATQAEVGPLLRLLWSRIGQTESGELCGLSAEHFSRDRALGACPACTGAGTIPRCDPERLITGASLPLDGTAKIRAMSGTRPGKFFGEADGQYMATLRAAAEIVSGVNPGDYERPWQDLSKQAQDLALFGAGQAGKTDLEVTWEFARGGRKGEHRFQGTWDGFAALIEREARNRKNARAALEWAEPLADVPCENCAGAGLRASVARVHIGGMTLGDALALPLAELSDALEVALAKSSSSELALEVGRVLLPELSSRLHDLANLGLGHLALSRPSRTLSEGELQRVRLASVLHAGLTGATLVLDEPAAGLHARDMEHILACLRRACEAGNTVVVVSHRPAFLRAADHLIEVGPGAGADGGHIVAAGPASEVLAGDTLTARALQVVIPCRTHDCNFGAAAQDGAQPRPVPQPQSCSHVYGTVLPLAAPATWRIAKAAANNLRDIDVELPTRGFVVVTGVSGSGKSSLVFDVLGASVEAHSPIECERVDFPNGDASYFREVKSSRVQGTGATPLSAMSLMTHMQRLFHDAAKTQGLDIPRQAFSFGSPAGRCEECKGAGVEKVAMDFMADLTLPCPKCAGRRYKSSVLEAKWQGLDVATFLETSAAKLRERLNGEPGKAASAIREALDALEEVGLSHLSLGRRRLELSGGESARLTLAASLLAAPSPSLYLFDEPARGLHEADLQKLADVFRRLGERGDLVVATEHRLSLIAAADWQIDLGPGGGPNGGELLAST